MNFEITMAAIISIACILGTILGPVILKRLHDKDTP